MEFTVQSTATQELLDITAQVEDLVAKSKIKEGLCHVYLPHASAAILVNENHDPELCKDVLDALNKVFPDHAGWRHDRIDDNAGAHIKASVLGPSETIPIRNGKLALGRWQAIMLAELDGPRQRQVVVTLLSQ